MTLNFEIGQILRRLTLSLDHPDFFLEIFKEVIASLNFSKNVAEQIFIDDVKNSIEMSALDPQNNIALRNIIITRKIASLLIHEPSKQIDEASLDLILSFLQNKGFILGPYNEADAPYILHIIKALTYLKNDAEVRNVFKSINKPINNTFSENLIKQTLGLTNTKSITDVDAKRAVLCSFICYFRQNVGSCFATAPAIIIQQEQPLRFLYDIKELIEIGVLKRVYEGNLYAVPISPSFGASSLKKPFFALDIINNITLSKSFLSCLQVANLIDEKLDETSQLRDLKMLLRKAFPKFKASFISLETILKKLILSSLQLEEDDVKYFKEVPKKLMDQVLSIDVSLKKEKKSKQELIEIFKEKFLLAKNYFITLTENPLLKSWEFTLASFAETKPNFLSWNLYYSLGLKSDEEAGIGSVIFSFLSSKMDENKNLIEETSRDYERVFLEVKALESQSRLIDSESKANTIKMQYNARRNEMDALLDKRDYLIEKTNQMSGLFVKLVDIFIEKFPQYFQEVYDADMQIVSEEFFDDSPAGFRLLFKHGRTNPSLWSLIYTPDQFIDHLARFFVLIENDISSREDLKLFQNEIPVIFDEIIRHVRTKDFLVSAFTRIALAHNLKPQSDPLNNLDKIPKKPWVYTSGGSMASLISCLYGLSDTPHEKSTWVESEMELLVFMADVLKELSSQLSQKYLDDKTKSMLAYTPTHAYIFKPGMQPFDEIWRQEQYTYTWIRDNFVIPQQNFIESLHLNQEMIKKIWARLFSFLPSQNINLIEQIGSHFSFDLKVYEFKDSFLNFIKNEPSIFSLANSYLSPSQIDKYLYEMLPFSSFEDLIDNVRRVLKEVLGHTPTIPDLLIEYFELHNKKYSYLSSDELQNIVKACLILMKKNIFFNEDFHKKIIKAMKKWGLAMPEPIMIGDANWPNSSFGFIVSPTTSKLEFWRFDYAADKGDPIPSWKKWLDGSDKKRWGLYNKPFEYGQ